MRKRLCAVTVVISILLTGCTSVPDLSNLHNDMEAEYMAGILLKYSEGNDDMLDYDRSVLNPTPTPAPSRTPAPEQSSTAPEKNDGESGDPGALQTNYVDTKQLNPMEGIVISQESYEMKRSYGSSSIAVQAHKGKRLLVVKFRLKNTGSSQKKVNMQKSDMTYSLEIGENSLGGPLKTILENDLQYYHANLSAGKSSEAVLIFEIGESQKLENAFIYVSDKAKTSRISLQ